MKDEITVVACLPGKPAIITSISSSLESMQQFVGGYIQAVYPFEEPVCIVCNEEAKLIGMELNRGLHTPDGVLYDIVAGPFFICDCREETFGSLNHEQQEKYKEIFKEPEVFVKMDGDIKSIKIRENNLPKQEKMCRISHRR